MSQKWIQLPSLGPEGLLLKINVQRHVVKWASSASCFDVTIVAGKTGSGVFGMGHLASLLVIADRERETIGSDGTLVITQILMMVPRKDSDEPSKLVGLKKEHVGIFFLLGLHDKKKRQRFEEVLLRELRQAIQSALNEAEHPPSCA